jgi:putative transposase
VACRVLNVPRSGYYEWKSRPESARASRDRELLKLIERVHEESRGSYGSPRVTAELRLGLGMEVNRKRVERLMRQAGIQGIYRRRGRKNLVNAATEEDLVRRSFTADWPGALWLTGITEHPTGEGKLYCAAVMAVFSRRIIGWSIAARQDTELVINALDALVKFLVQRLESVLDLGFGAAGDLAADPLAVLNARYRTSPAARTMPVMLRIAALTAMIEVNGIATAPTTALDFLWHAVSLTLRLPLRLPSDD